MTVDHNLALMSSLSGILDSALSPASGGKPDWAWTPWVSQIRAVAAIATLMIVTGVDLPDFITSIIVRNTSLA